MVSVQFTGSISLLVSLIVLGFVDSNDDPDLQKLLLKHDDLINDLITENRALKYRLEKTEEELGKIKSQHPTRRFVFDENGFKVAFTAKLGVAMHNIGLHQTIIFERVHTNQANAYSPTTGVFTAPVNGTYFFTSTIMCHQGDFVETEMVQDGQHVVYMYASDSNFEQGTNSAVVVMNQGDHVWIRNARKETHQIYGNDWSTFTGFLLYPGDM